MQALVLLEQRCPSDNLSVCHTLVLYQNMISLPTESLNTVVFLENIRIIPKFQRIHPERGRFIMRLGLYELAICDL